MPGYKAHLATGAVVAGALLYVMPQPPMLAAGYTVCTLAGALFPDIDTKSKGQMLFYKLFFCVFVTLVFLQQFHVATFFSLLLFVPVLARHRGMFHRVWFLCALSLFACVYVSFCLTAYKTCASQAILFFLLGALSHVWLDIGVRGMIRWK
jgi:hypothetical protein